MEILILGGSYGLELPHMTKEKHVVSLLKEKGHSVHNCAIGGGSNLASLAKAKHYIAQQSKKIDWVLWFSPELSRDKDIMDWKPMSIQHFMKELSNIVYSKYANFFRQLDCKVAVVGGGVNLYDTFYNHIQPDFCIQGWIEELVGVKVFCLNTAEWVPYINDSTENKFRWIDSHTNALMAVDNSSDFPDGGHPGTNAHTHLAERLLRAFNQT